MKRKWILTIFWRNKGTLGMHGIECETYTIRDIDGNIIKGSSFNHTNQYEIPNIVIISYDSREYMPGERMMKTWTAGFIVDTVDTIDTNNTDINRTIYKLQPVEVFDVKLENQQTFENKNNSNDESIISEVITYDSSDGIYLHTKYIDNKIEEQTKYEGLEAKRKANSMVFIDHIVQPINVIQTQTDEKMRKKIEKLKTIAKQKNLY